ncbi:protein PHOX1-like [Salvia hispanica]|uniref:protein PHOX1-like n=1 Tax=Salvia hispanica TaxID=49212 RepID=UPI00200918BD|nr:protein PHOX1-like [Salvia hispanica]XP_047940393.1 protein PHOX1-like [Salvia hispanica]XP_047940394.1 protein PHOX1-like [Salvia hispanica]
MENQSERDKGVHGDKWRELIARHNIQRPYNSHRPYDIDTVAFMSMAQKLKEDGNRLFQKRDYGGAILKYEKSIKLLPDFHADMAYLRSNMAECYMQLGVPDYPRAIHECHLALMVIPNYCKALLKRARCHEALQRPDLALRDIRLVLRSEPNNLMACEIEERLRRVFERQGSRLCDIPVDLVPTPDYTDSPSSSSSESRGGYNERELKGKFEERTASSIFIRAPASSRAEKNSEDKVVVEVEKLRSSEEEELKRTVKLVFKEDIRWTQIPVKCDILKLRQIIAERFPSSKAVMIKYKDQEGDMVTISTTEEMRLVESSADDASIKLHVIEVSPDQDPLFRKLRQEKMEKKQASTSGKEAKSKEMTRSESSCISDWIIQFAQFFKNHVGFDIDAYIDLHELGVKLYSEAMEETVTSDEAQGLFTVAADKFQELAALAMFNWGNVHMSRARKKVYFTDDSSRQSVLEQIKTAFDYAQKEFSIAGKRYEEALKIKPNFYEAVLANGQGQFEQAKLSWYYAVATEANIESWPSGEVLMLYNNAEENMEKGMQMWEDLQEQRMAELHKENNIESLLQRMNLDNLFKLVSADELEEQANNIRSQIFVLWGTMLYERSVMEYKLGLPVWQECLEVSVEKFEQAGASSADIAVMIKNHCSNDTGLECCGFNIDEIVQAWNEMYEAKKWQRNISSFRLEPLLRRRVSKLYTALESA